MLHRLEPHKDWGTFILRITIGIIFIMHGYQKFFVWGIGGVAQGFGKMGLPFPEVNAYLAASAEFLGGILLLIGLFTRYAAIPIAFTMVVAFLSVHMKGGFFLPSGFEYVFALFAASIALLFHGSGPLALDNVLFHRSANRDDALPHGTLRPA